jgi:hypothetical protein
MLFRLLIFLLVFTVAYRLVKRLLRGMIFQSTRPTGVVGRVAGKTIYFCSQECLEKYLRDSNHTTTQEQ